MAMGITIVDYHMGNIHALYKKVKQLGATPVVSSDPKVISKANKIILPGIGHFAMAMENLKKLNITETLHESALVKKTPVLGICLGMQLMAQKSEEGNSNGLGWFDADVIRLRVKDPAQHKVPHIGWNTININHRQNPLMNGITAGDEFYFVHSYHIKIKKTDEALSHTHYDYTFVSAISKENIYGVQFHPEKSHEAGLLLFRNFIQI